MTVKNAPRLQKILAMLSCKPRRVEPSHEGIIKSELRFLLERDCYQQVIQRLEDSPEQIGQLVELLGVRDIELPGIAALSQLAKRAVDISGAIDALSVRLLCDELNISSYSSRALTHYHLVRGNLEDVELLLSSGIPSVQYGCAEGLRESVLANNAIATDFAIKKVFSDSREIQENAVWALRTSAETGSADVCKTISELALRHMRKIKCSDNPRLDVFRCLARVYETAASRAE
jgi:hypothetical protein